jgi:hypothetical protein
MVRFTPVLWLGLFVALAGCGSGISVTPPAKDSRPDKNVSPGKGESKIVGTWKLVKSSNNREPAWGTTLELTPHGKLLLRGPGYANEGTYSVEKNKLKMNAVNMNPTLTIKKVTDRDLILEEEVPFSDTITIEYQRK